MLEGKDEVLVGIGAAVADVFDKQQPLAWRRFNDVQTTVDALGAAIKSRKHDKAAKAYEEAVGAYGLAVDYVDGFFKQNLAGAETGRAVAKTTVAICTAVLAAFAGPMLAGSTIAGMNVSEGLAFAIVHAAEWGGGQAVTEWGDAVAGKQKTTRQIIWNIGTKALGGAVYGRLSRAIKFDGNVGKWVIDKAGKQFGAKLPWLTTSQCRDIAPTLVKETGQVAAREALKQIVKLVDKQFVGGKGLKETDIRRAAWDVVWAGVFAGPLSTIKTLDAEAVRANEDALRTMIPKSSAWRHMENPDQTALEEVFESVRKKSFQKLM